MNLYVCLVCGNIYDPVNGSPDAGVKPGIPFEQLPDDNACPYCGASKDFFEKVQSKASEDSHIYTESSTEGL